MFDCPIRRKRWKSSLEDGISAGAPPDATGASRKKEIEYKKRRIRECIK